MRTLLLLLDTTTLLLTACGSPHPTPAPAASSARPKSVAIGPRERTYLATLGSLDPALAADPVRAILRAHAVCQDLAEGKDHTAVVTATATEFADSHGPVSRTKAVEILAAIESSLICS